MNEKIPTHVAIIMDGNRRWAKMRNKNSLDGHKAGAENLRKLGPYILSKGVKFLSVFAFSTENFKRSADEVKYLMDMIIYEFNHNAKVFMDKNVKVVFSGRREGLRDDVLKSMDNIEAKTKNNDGGILNICINYGGQAEIIDAIKNINKDVLSGKIELDSIDEDIVNHHLYQNLPPVDYMIRTSGEYRISNYMLWQLAYAELLFADAFFPDFNSEEFDKALEEYFLRERRYGGN